MPRYVAFVRGVNILGHRRITAQDLARAFARAGAEEVRTFGASGNVLFATHAAGAEVRRRAEQALARRMGGEVTVLLRTPAALRALVREDPFGPPARVPEHRNVTFLERASPSRLPDLPARSLRVVAVRGREVLTVTRRLPGKQRFADPTLELERLLGQRGTTRMWRVVRGIAEAAARRGGPGGGA